jgi:hypothetical protein
VVPQAWSRSFMLRLLVLVLLSIGIAIASQRHIGVLRRLHSHASPVVSPLAPLNAVMMTASHSSIVDVLVLLSSIALHSPDVVVLLTVDASIGAALYHLYHLSPTSSRAALPRWLRLYATENLTDGRHHGSAWSPKFRRYVEYVYVLDDLAALGDGAASASVIYSSLDASRLRSPAGILLIDANDAVFQSDPFPALWRAAGGVCDASQAVLVAAEESHGYKFNKNNVLVEGCFGPIGSSIAAGRYILCSGTTFGTLAGIMAYLEHGMLPAFEFCASLVASPAKLHGDQAVHNVLMHQLSANRFAELRQSAELQQTALSHYLPFLNVIAAFQQSVTVVVVESDSGVICSIAGSDAAEPVPLYLDPDGWVVRSPGQDRCSIVHHYDNYNATLVPFYRASVRTLVDSLPPHLLHAPLVHLSPQKSAHSVLPPPHSGRRMSAVGIVRDRGVLRTRFQRPL